MSKRTLPDAGESTVSMEPDVAIAIIGVYSGAADGEGISEAEEDALNEMLEVVEVFEDYTEDDFADLTETVNHLIQTHSPEDLITSAIAALPDEDYCEAAYKVAVIVTATDDFISENEEDYLYALQQGLNIPDKRAYEIFRELFPPIDEDEEDEDI